MKISELISKLEARRSTMGDVDVEIDVPAFGITRAIESVNACQGPGNRITVTIASSMREPAKTRGGPVRLVEQDPNTFNGYPIFKL